MTSAAIPREAFTPLVKSIVVPWSPTDAFKRWTTDIGSWWPTKTHSVGQAKVKSLVFGGGVGGRCYEVWHDGTEKEWGRVTTWDPPRLVRYTWYPDRTPDSAQDIEVRFEPEGAGTRLTLTHTGWERLGKDARKARRGYPIGWSYVLSLFAGKKGPLVYALDFVGVLLRAVQR